MNDLELMYLLEENEYEPNIENLMILKEGLESGEIEIFNEYRKYIRDAASSGNTESLSREDKARVLAHVEGRTYAEHKNDKGSTEYKKFIADSKKTGKNAKTLAVKLSGAKKLPEDTGNHSTRARHRSGSKALRESFSDYELYQILEENGYTTTEKNLSILKEGIENGKYIIETDEKFYKSDFLGEPPIDINFDGDERPKNKGLKSLSKKIKPMLRKNPIDCSRENCKTD